MRVLVLGGTGSIGAPDAVTIEADIPADANGVLYDCRKGPKAITEVVLRRDHARC
jgi:hypothetical protein